MPKKVSVDSSLASTFSSKVSTGGTVFESSKHLQPSNLKLHLLGEIAWRTYPDHSTVNSCVSLCARPQSTP